MSPASTRTKAKTVARTKAKATIKTAKTNAAPSEPRPRPLPRSRPVAAARRCFWADGDPLLAAYHDEEWGVPVHDDRRWYEKLVLDGAQAGLSWLTILRKREGYREAFAGFDPAAVARYTAGDAARLLTNPGIVRNRAKIKSAIENARAFGRVQAEHGSFDAFIWSFVDGRAVQGRVRGRADIVARTELSDTISKQLRARGFSFVGSTIVYAFMQASGLVNDHMVGCLRRSVVARMK
jgi:DNA-3-methyladenine glycosylase I